MAQDDATEFATPTGGIALAVLSYNNAGTIGSTIRTLHAGIETYFPGRNYVLLHADGGSRDGTPDAARAASGLNGHLVQTTFAIHSAHKLWPEYYGVPGRMSALRAVCEAAGDRKIEACAIVDANVKNPSPEWVRSLAQPLTDDGFDLVRPCYLRHKFDAAILTGIVYPLVRALYGKRLEQPMGGEIALSGRLIEYLLKQRWEGDPASPGWDVWITTQAIAGGFRVAQSFLGARSIDAGDSPPEVSAIIAQALSAVFAEMERAAPVWQRVRNSENVASFGPCGEPETKPAPLDVTGMEQSFRLGYQNLQDIWRLVLPPATMLDLKRLSKAADGAPRFGDELWARIVYDFALAWRIRTMDRDHLLGALTPLYLGWAASYLLSLRDTDLKETQNRVEALCLAFERQKAYLISRWRWPDRFNP